MAEKKRVINKKGETIQIEHKTLEKKTIIKTIQEFILTCPYLKEYKRLFPIVNIDKIDADATNYMIQSEPINPWLTKYLDGTGTKQFAFSLASMEFYGMDSNANEANSEFYERFSDWLDECTKKGTFPDMGEGKQFKKVLATTPGYVYNTGETKAQYQIQCRLEYYQLTR